MTNSKGQAPLLAVHNLSVDFELPDQRIARAVRDVSFAIRAGERVALVGESGSGKSTVANAIMRLEDPGIISPTSSVLLDGVEMTRERESALRRIRGNVVSRVAQNSGDALNPVHRVGHHQIVEALRAHGAMSSKEARQTAEALLASVQIPDANMAARAYPHEFSGGMVQRAFIAMALAAKPKLLIADEPTSNLDVSVQADILELLDTQVAQQGMAMLLITHDLAVVAGRSDRVLVLYNGRIVESGSTEDVFYRPEHPYTKALLASVSRLDVPTQKFVSIDGSPPDPTEMIPGCPYRLRGCPLASERCVEERPVLEAVAKEHTVACHEVVRVLEEGSAHVS